MIKSLLNMVLTLMLVVSFLTHSLGGCCFYHHNHHLADHSTSKKKIVDKTHCCCHHHENQNDDESSETQTPSQKNCEHESFPCTLKNGVQPNSIMEVSFSFLTTAFPVAMTVLPITDLDDIFVKKRFEIPPVPLYQWNQVLLI